MIVKCIKKSRIYHNIFSNSQIYSITNKIKIIHKILNILDHNQKIQIEVIILKIQIITP